MAEKKLGKFASLFIKEVDSSEVSKSVKKQEVVEEVEQRPKASNMKFAPVTLDEPVSKGAVVGVIDNDIYDKLAQAISDNDLDGEDYLEFKNSIKKLLNYGMTEEKLYNAAFDVLNSLTYEKLCSSLDHYIGVVEQQKDNFKSALSENFETQVGSKQKAIENINVRKEEAKQKIEELQNSIVELTEQENALSGEMQETQHKLKVTEANFIVTSEKLIEQLSQDKIKIEKHLLAKAKK